MRFVSGRDGQPRPMRRKLMVAAMLGLAIVLIALLISVNKGKKGWKADAESDGKKNHPSWQAMSTMVEATAAMPKAQPLEPTRGGPIRYPSDVPVGARVLPAYYGQKPPIDTPVSSPSTNKGRLEEVQKRIAAGEQPPDPFAPPPAQDAIIGGRPPRPEDILRMKNEGTWDGYVRQHPQWR